MPTAFGLTAVLFLVLANAFFVATEFAIVAVRKSRLEQLAADGSAAAVAAREITAHLDAYIAACQFGITMASLALGWIGEPALAHLILPLLQGLLGGMAPAAAHTIAIGSAFAIITALHIVVGELAPKGVALQSPERTALWIAQPIRLFYRVFRLPIGVLNAVGNFVLRLLGFRPASGHEMVHSAAELALLVDESHEAGVVEESEAEIATRAFRFADTTAGDLMTPRTHLVAVPLDAEIGVAAAAVSQSGHRYLLAYDRSPDDTVGAVHVRDLLRACLSNAGGTITPLVRDLPLVTASRGADELLEDMRRLRTGIVVVTDEHGSTVGIVTLHDLLEGLVGPIDLNVDREPEIATIGPVEADGSRPVSGLLRISELEALIGEKLDGRERSSARTVAGLVVATLGRVAEVGESVTLSGWTFRVEERRGQRVAQVRLIPPAPPDPAAALAESRQGSRS